jgi:hypothetical protein
MTALLPEIRRNGAVKQLFVDGKPFIMLFGEVHNSTASSAEYLKTVLNNLAALHLNTVIGAVSREFTEPEGGRFDFSRPPGPSPNDTRPFAIVVNTAPGEFFLIGANGTPKFTADSPGPANVAIASKEEGRYEQGKWIRARRLNGDEITNGLPSTRIGLMKVSLLRFD